MRERCLIKKTYGAANPRETIPFSTNYMHTVKVIIILVSLHAFYISDYLHKIITLHYAL